MSNPTPLATTSSLFDDYAEALREAELRGPVIDLACGRGRHALAAAKLGLPVVGIDHHRGHLDELQQHARAGALAIARVQTDLETPYGLPLKSGGCGAILVFRFLYRPLVHEIERALAPGGLLLYETFWRGLRKPDFLLARGELPSLFPNLDVLRYRENDSECALAARKPNDALKKHRR